MFLLVVTWLSVQVFLRKNSCLLPQNYTLTIFIQRLLRISTYQSFSNHLWLLHDECKKIWQYNTKIECILEPRISKVYLTESPWVFTYFYFIRCIPVSCPFKDLLIYVTFTTARRKRKPSTFTDRNFVSFHSVLRRNNLSLKIAPLRGQ